MQPTIICTSPVPGMLSINGRFAGEIGPERPLCAPVSPTGAVYLEYRPLSGGAAPLARRCVFSGGELLPESVAEAEGLCCVAWPGGAAEIEFDPVREETVFALLEGLPCQLVRGASARLILDGAALPLPRGAGMPRISRMNGAPLLLGETDAGGQYAAVLSADLRTETALIEARRIDLSGGALNALVPLDDSVGHGRLEQWALGAGEARLASWEPVWIDGAPRWPRTAEGAMIAAVEAALAGLPSESDGYLSPALAAEAPLRDIASACDLCAPMKYAAPGGDPCAALLKAANDHLAFARPLYYRAANAGGLQSPWRIDALSLESPVP